MATQNLEDLLVHELSDMHNAEKQLIKALPKLAKAATDPALSALFEDHLAETEIHVERLEQIFKICNEKVKRKKCEPMAILIEESNKMAKEIPAGHLRDIALIACAQKAENHEISSYLSIMRLAHELGFQKAIPLLSQILDDEEHADQSLARLSSRNLHNAIRQSRFEHGRSHQDQATARYA
jgi:ferritin-like metal-binding protein YciE